MKRLRSFLIGVLSFFLLIGILGAIFFRNNIYLWTLGDVGTLYMEAMECYKNPRYEDAISLFEKLAAIDTAVARTANLLELPIAEVKNRATVAGDISIARLPGAVTLTAQFPKSVLKKANLFKFVKRQYD